MQGLGGKKQKYEGKIVTGNTDKDFAQYAAAMEQLLAEWSPVGHTAGEVEFVIGPSSKPGRDGLIYHFENGRVGVEWGLRLRDGRVAEVRTALMD